MSKKSILWLCYEFIFIKIPSSSSIWLWSSAVEWLVGKTVGSETTVINDDTEWQWPVAVTTPVRLRSCRSSESETKPELTRVILSSWVISANDVTARSASEQAQNYYQAVQLWAPGSGGHMWHWWQWSWHRSRSGEWGHRDHNTAHTTASDTTAEHEEML